MVVMSKPVILTGLRANNDLHIGNYFGALLPLIDMAKTRADEFEINLFVPDLHSFTTPIEHSQLQAQIMHNLKLFVAAGLPLDNPNIRIYRQSYIPAHSELTWILDCFTGFGQMRRMTQFKEKTKTKERLDQAVVEAELYHKAMQTMGQASNYEELSAKQLELSQHMNAAIDLIGQIEDRQGTASVGLFNYPVLMAADILLYDAEYVPVGDDQTQHLEFARDIAERMNNKFGELFVVPKPVKQQHEFFGKDQGLRIKDLSDPSRKMSKSDETGKGIIFLGDTPEAASKKIMSATTDSVGVVHYDIEKQPGVANLLQIMALAEGGELSSVVDRFEGQTSYGDLKTAVAASLRELLSSFQAKLEQVNEAALLAKLQVDEAAMNEKANQTLLKVQKAVGLR